MLVFYITIVKGLQVLTHSNKEGIMKLKFIDNENFYFVSQCQFVDEQRVRLFGDDIPKNTSGFELYDDNTENPSLFFDGLEHKIVSNSTDKYIEYTNESLDVLLKNSKESKIAESKALLASYLESHPLISNCHGGIEAEYTVTSEKQALMSSNYLTYTIAKASGLDAKLTWNAAGQECEEWTEEEYVTLVLQISEYVKPLVSLQQSYEVAINNCTTQEELDAIDIVYDVYGVAENE